MFFTAIYGPAVPGDERFMCIAHLRPNGKMIERFFRWDSELDQALGHVEHLINEAKNGRGANIYYCVSLLTGYTRTKDFVDQTHCVWADLDTTAPKKLAAPPTFLTETSPGRYQAIWTLVEPIPGATAEDFARRVYHAHRGDGADATWDCTRLLRVPGTPNLKYTVNAQYPLVNIDLNTGAVYTLDEFDAAYPISVTQGPGTSQSVVLDYSMVNEVGSAEEILRRYHKELAPDVLELIYTAHDPEDERWSHRQWALEMSLFEAGMDIYEVFVVMKVAKCNKYERDGRPDADLWRDIVRARETVETKAGLVLTTTEIEEIDLLTPEEIGEVVEQPECFIERFQSWASSRTDAPREFHIGGALMALSTALSEKVVVGTAFGDVRPNVWVMLISDSTISRKTTSMRLAMEIADGAGIDSLLATDGSIEGLLTELQARDGRTSMFMRDEFTSLVAGAKKKDYMSGLLSDLCGLYDGSRIKRRLRKEIIEAKRPIFLLFAGGVESKLLELLGHEDITSGFIPRFLPIFGRTSVAELDLIGPRRKRSFTAKDELIAELKSISDMYTPPRAALRVPNGDSTINMTTPLEMDLSEAAWNRLQTANRYLLEMADGHDSRDLLLPCTERLIVNVLKVAALITCSRQRPVVDGKVTIELDDLMMSLYYARGWLDHLLRIVTKVGRDPFDGLTHRVLEYITWAGEGGVGKGHIMRQFRSNRQEMNEILETLAEREEIVIEGGAGPSSRGAIFRATQHARTAKQIRVAAVPTVRRSNPATRS
jgi:hypothetical protein